MPRTADRFLGFQTPGDQTTFKAVTDRAGTNFSNASKHAIKKSIVSHLQANLGRTQVWQLTQTRWTSS
jgi:hypothetical protein